MAQTINENTFALELKGAGMSWEFPGYWTKALGQVEIIMMYEAHDDPFPHSLDESGEIQVRDLIMDKVVATRYFDIVMDALACIKEIKTESQARTLE